MSGGLQIVTGLGVTYLIFAFIDIRSFKQPNLFDVLLSDEPLLAKLI